MKYEEFLIFLKNETSFTIEESYFESEKSANNYIIISNGFRKYKFSI